MTVCDIPTAPVTCIRAYFSHVPSRTLAAFLCSPFDDAVWTIVEFCLQPSRKFAAEINCMRLRFSLGGALISAWIHISVAMTCSNGTSTLCVTVTDHVCFRCQTTQTHIPFLGHAAKLRLLHCASHGVSRSTNFGGCERGPNRQTGTIVRRPRFEPASQPRWLTSLTA